MENKCKKCGKIIEGEGFWVVTNSWDGEKQLPEEKSLYCSSKCYWDEYIQENF